MKRRKLQRIIAGFWVVVAPLLMANECGSGTTQPSTPPAVHQPADPSPVQCDSPVKGNCLPGPSETPTPMDPCGHIKAPPYCTKER